MLPDVKMIYARFAPSTRNGGSRSLSLSMSALAASRSIKTAEVRGACSTDRRLPITIETPAASASPPFAPAPRTGSIGTYARARLEYAKHGHDLIDEPVHEQADPDLGAGTRASADNAPADWHAHSIRHKSTVRRRRPEPSVRRGADLRLEHAVNRLSVYRQSAPSARFHSLWRRVTPRHDPAAFGVGE